MARLALTGSAAGRGWCRGGCRGEHPVGQSPAAVRAGGCWQHSAG